MSEFWENAFKDKQLMWGRAPARSAVLAAERFEAWGVHDVLIPGIGYGRNARPFLERGMAVTGIEASATAIALARGEMGLELPIFYGSVAEMPFETREYDGIFCFGLAYLLDDDVRRGFLNACYRQLAPGGTMIMTVVSKEAPLHGGGTRLIYDEDSIRREFGPVGLLEFSRVDESGGHGNAMPFFDVTCRKLTTLDV